MKHYISSQRFYRDNTRRKISGVCAGLARYFEQPTWVARLLAIVSFVLLPVPTALAYLLAVVLVPAH